MLGLTLTLSLLCSAKLGLAVETGRNNHFTPMCDDTPIIEVRHQIELLSAANNNLRLHLDILSERIDRQTGILNDISKKLDQNEQQGLTREWAPSGSLTDGHPGTSLEALLVNSIKHQTGILNQINRKLDPKGRTGEPSNLITDIGSESNLEALLINSLRNQTGILREISNQLVKPESSAFPTNCAEAVATSGMGGRHVIQIPNYSDSPFIVNCDNETQGGGWTIIQRRKDGSVDFFRDWADYQRGFGENDGEFFIGLDKLHAMTSTSPQELLIVMRDSANVEKFARYDGFAIADEQDGYALKLLGKYSGDAGDALTYHQSHRFATKDNDTKRGCATMYTGAWWYNQCFESNLNGKYGDRGTNGIIWKSFRGFTHSLPFVQMMIRPKHE